VIQAGGLLPHMSVAANIGIAPQKLGGRGDESGRPSEAAPHPQQIIRIRMAQAVEPYSILRRDAPVKKEKLS